MDENTSYAADIARVQQLQNPWLVPGAIIAAGIILALAVYADRTHHILSTPQGSLSDLRPVSPDDHLLGNPSAPVTLIEYGDIDSEYSKQFQAVMEQLMTEYAAGGKVAWVYRHFPLIDQHPYAESHAEAAECTASLAGPAAFWHFIDTLSASAPGSSQFDPRDYSAIVPTLGIDATKFTACMDAHTFQQRVGVDFKNAMLIGATGTPYSVLLVKGQDPVTISGSVPYDAMKQIIDESIQKADAAK